MKRGLLTVGVTLALTLAAFRAHAGDTQKAKVDEPAPKFTLTDYKGEAYSLEDFEGSFVVLEWTNMECPFVRKHYDSGNMPNLQTQYTDKGVVWLRICSSAPGKQGYFEASVIGKRTKAEKSAATAYLVDADGAVGRTYGAKTTPHMFVIDPDGVLIYAGGIDSIKSTDQADIKRATNYVSSCLDAAMAGQPVEVKTSTPYGCSVKYAKNEAKTDSKSEASAGY